MRASDPARTDGQCLGDGDASLAVAAAGGHGAYPALALPPAALAPVVDALAQRTMAFGVNFP